MAKTAGEGAGKTPRKRVSMTGDAISKPAKTIIKSAPKSAKTPKGYRDEVVRMQQTLKTRSAKKPR